MIINDSKLQEESRPQVHPLRSGLGQAFPSFSERSQKTKTLLLWMLPQLSCDHLQPYAVKPFVNVLRHDSRRRMDGPCSTLALPPPRASQHYTTEESSYVLSKRAVALFSRSKYSRVPLPITPVCLNPHTRPLLLNHEVSRKQRRFMGCVSLSAADSS